MARMATKVFMDQVVCNTGDTYSETIPIEYIYGYSVEADWTVTPGTKATIYLLATNLEDKPVNKLIPIDCTAQVISADDGKIWNVDWPMYKYFVFKVHVDSGSVTMTANFYAKGF